MSHRKQLTGRRVGHKSTGGILPSIPEPVDPVANAAPLTFNTVAPGTGFDLEGQTASPRIPIHWSVSAGALEKHRWGQHTQVTQTQRRECGTAGAHNIGLGLSSEFRSNAPTHSRVRR